MQAGNCTKLQPNATATPVAFDRLIKTNKKQAVSCVGGLRKEKVGIIGLVCTVLIIIDRRNVCKSTDAFNMRQEL